MAAQEMTSSSSSVAVLPGIARLASEYRVIFCDVWGVLHNGVTAYPASVNALTRFREQGGVVVLVSNAPRPGGEVAKQLEQFGVTSAAFDAIATSGDVSREAIRARSGQSVYHIGPPRDLPVFEGANVRFAPLEVADYVVCTGLDEDETETVATYLPVLEVMRRRKLWMLCANPDLVVERGDVLVECAGSIAAAYEDMGGEVYWAGKPYPPVYERALAMASSAAGRSFSKSDVIAVGDAIRTDVAGAITYGIDCVMIARGIHSDVLGLERGGEFSPQRVVEWINGQQVRPRAVIDMLAW